MGGGMAGNFGSTAGVSGENILDSISNFLTAASLIPGLDTFTDLAAIPVDLARGDYVSAGLDLLGVIPFVGEVADTAKIARVADKAIDSAKTVNKISDTGKLIKIPKLPKTPSKLKSNGWKETTSVAMRKNTTSRTFQKDNLSIRFDKGKKGAGGYGGKDHYHVLNPKSTGKHDYYLDKNGNPVPKNSKASHIIP